MIGAFLLTGCGFSETDRARDRTENAEHPAGLAANTRGLSKVTRGASFAATTADEGRAAEVGRDILQAGGNATDAAAAMYFALAVTLPSAASLGASGACVVHNDKTKKAEAFVFAPVAAPGPIRGQSFSVPSGVRAITLMHVRHGSLRWEQTVSPGERMARFGVPVSRGLSRDLQAGGGLIGADAEARRIFGTAAEGASLVQPDLAATLGAIRQRGGGEFFQGAFARTFSEQVSLAGGSLPFETLRSTVPQASAPLTETHYRSRVYTAPAPAAGAAAMAGWKGQQPGGSAPADSGGFAGFAAGDVRGGAPARRPPAGPPFGGPLVGARPGTPARVPAAPAPGGSPPWVGKSRNARGTLP
ncbi:MAG: gamma-glutamyltransferase, partial [Reyranella sp.]|nr:gamma-glutamyltransferase [Reyranella sp.]